MKYYFYTYLCGFELIQFSRNHLGKFHKLFPKIINVGNDEMEILLISDSKNLQISIWIMVVKSEIQEYNATLYLENLFSTSLSMLIGKLIYVSGDNSAASVLQMLIIL